MLVLVFAGGAVGCNGSDNGGRIDASCVPPSAPVTVGAAMPPAADFVDRIDNPFFPLKPGSRWQYVEDDQRIVVTVTNETKQIMGITARVVRDVVTADDGALVEDTFDWYAQDKAGNVWYLGEDTKEFENGKVVSTKGSWTAGVNGAAAGIIMPANPAVGMAYRQQFPRGRAEDAARVLAIGERVAVPAGTFTDTVKTADYTPLEPALCENKVYARGVGSVLTTHLSGGTGRGELVSYTIPS